MSVSETDTFYVSHKTHIAEERELFQASVTWKVCYIGLRKYDSDNIRITSPLFHCGNGVWELGIFESNKCHALCLRMVHPETPVYCSLYIKFVIFDETGNIFHQDSHFPRRFREVINPYAKFQYMDVENVLPDIHALTRGPKQSATLHFDLVVGEQINEESMETAIELLQDQISTVRELRERSDFSTLSKDYFNLYSNPVTADVTLKIDLDEFPAHKLVLGSRSKVFRKMFEHDMQETQQNTVCIDQMEANTLKDLLYYMYCGKVRQLPPDESIKLYIAADRYQLMELKSICRELMTSGMSTENVCRMADIANLFNDQLLLEMVQYYVKENAKDLVKTEEWKLYSINKPAFSIKLLEYAVSR